MTKTFWWDATTLLMPSSLCALALRALQVLVVATSACSLGHSDLAIVASFPEHAKPFVSSDFPWNAQSLTHGLIHKSEHSISQQNVIASLRLSSPYLRVKKSDNILVLL